jgi:hypothetical protein
MSDAKEDINATDVDLENPNRKVVKSKLNSKTRFGGMLTK